MNNFSVLPFYSSVAEQNHRLPYAYGAVYPLYCDDTRILPFQIIRPTRQNTITSVILFDKDGTQVRDLTSDMTFNIVALEDYDVIVYTAQFGYAQELPIGQYYISVSDGAQTWFSDIFTIVSDITPYVKLEWYDEGNFVMDAGTIIYKNPRFINRLYLKTEIGKPDYQFEEEGEQRDGYFFPEKQLSEKTYRFTILAPEYLCDVMRFIRMADHIQITADGYTYNADTFLITPKWQTQGDLASVEVEFESNTVAKKLGDARVRRTIGDFNDDYNDDYDGDDTPVPPVPPAPTEAPESDVNFYDYTGFRVASYTIEEAKALTELPTPPSHEGLTFQEWNWTLNDIATYDRQYIDVGACFITTDEKTHLHAIITATNVSLIVRGLNGTVTVEWGDNIQDAYTFSSQANNTFTHTYSSVGHYVLKFSYSGTGWFTFQMNNNANYLWENILIEEINCGSGFTSNTTGSIKNLYSSIMAVSFHKDMPAMPSVYQSFIKQIVVPRNADYTSIYTIWGTTYGRMSLPREIKTLNGTSEFFTSVFPRIILPQLNGSGATIPTGVVQDAKYNIISIPNMQFSGNVTFNTSVLQHIDIVNGWTPTHNITISSQYLSAEAMVDFFTKLGTTATTITLTFGRTNLGRLTAAQKAIATDKGYTLA